MTSPNVTQADLHLLRKEIEAQGEFISQERLERSADVDRIEIQIAALRQVLEDAIPDFDKKYQEAYAQCLQNFNPEAKAG